MLQITIDVSAPHEGAVHDGIRGEPEVDYQQDLHIDVHWEGFFDRESGVEFYQYIFSDHCFSDEEFKNSTKVWILAWKEVNSENVTVGSHIRIEDYKVTVIRRTAIILQL